MRPRNKPRSRRGNCESRDHADYTRRGRVWHKLEATVHGHKLLTGSDLGTASSGPVMRTITFTADDRQALAHDRYHHPDPRVQRKMEVLWLKSHGLPQDQIADYADVSRRSVKRYTRRGRVWHKL